MRTIYLIPFFLLSGLVAKGQANFDKESECRTQTFPAYPTVEETAGRLKTSGYNPFENPTGIRFTQGET